MSRPWNESTKRSVTIGLAIILAVLLYGFSDILPPLIIATIIAYILTPVVDFLQGRTRIPRSLCVLAVDLAAIALLAAIPAIVAPALIREAAEVDISTQTLLSILERYLNTTTTLFGIEINLADLYARFAFSMGQSATPLLSRGLYLLVDIASGLFWVTLVFVLSFYLMRDWRRIALYLHSVVPPDYQDDYAKLMTRFASIWHSFFRGQVTLSLVIGVVVASTTAIIGLPSALVLGLLAGLLEVIPNFGPTIAAIPAVVLALLLGSTWLPISNLGFALLVVGLYVIIQWVENNFLVPRIIGSSVKLHPMVVLVGAIAGALLAGVLGVLLSAPVVASAKAILSYIYAKLLDTDPFPETHDVLLQPTRQAVPTPSPLAVARRLLARARARD